MAMRQVEPLSNVDAAWLGMEDPTNLMMVSGILTFAEPINVEHLQAVLAHRLLKFDRFRMRTVRPKMMLSQAYWETDMMFDMRYHLRRVALPSPGDKAALQTMVSELMSTPLDYSKPLWQVHLIENYGAGSAVMVRLHHAIADGMALVFVLLSLTDMVPDAPWPKAVPTPEPAPAAAENELPGPLQSLLKQASSAAHVMRDVTGKVVKEGLETLVNPAHAAELAMQGTDTAMAAGRLVFRTPDPQTMFKGSLGVMKRASWSRPLPLRDVKKIKNHLGATVNDVLVSAMTGSLRRYLVAHEQDVVGLNFRAAVPVNLRKPEEMGTLGNKFGIVFLSLPVGIAEPEARLAEVCRRMNALKDSAEAPVSLGILNAIGMTPVEMQDRLVDMFGAKATAVMTNVPGPPLPLYLAGSKIEDLMFWVPQSGRVSLGISILSYANKVYLGVASDEGLVPNADSIIDGFYAEFEALLALAQTPAAAAAVAEPERAATTDNRCQGITKSGRSCKKRPRAGSNYCHLHQP